MSSIDEIWASMNPSSAATKVATPSGVKKAKKVKDKTKELSSNEVAAPKTVLDYAAMTAKIAKYAQSCEDTELGVRKKALMGLHSALFVDHTMSDEDYSEVFRDICKKIFKRFADPSEKCRELAQKITHNFFEQCSDIVPTLGYYFPALMGRIPPGFGFDEDLKVFVSNLEDHEAYKRGRAVDRQDRTANVGAITHTVVEPSEEIRYLNCLSLLALIKRVCAIGACPVLHPYFQEIIFFLQIQLKDPYPELKVVTCTALEVLAHVDDFEQGMKFFAVGLVRSILPVLRHRLAKVRVAGIAAMHACMVVKDRAKQKASGSEAISDLVGFREDNVLPIASFYKSEVQINHLAELVIDKSLPVREELVKFLYTLLTEIGDRYDHHTRLLPYVLDLMTDENEGVASSALATLQKCGREYESEHEDEIKDRRQYGVDGDDRINLSKPLPRPFLERPRIGMRLYIRGTCKRFLNALVNELTNWVSTTRLKSANLLKMLVVLCEEHLTMEAHTLFPSFIKALKFAYDDKDNVLYATLLELYELVGRYISPEVYIYYVLPRLRGDVDVVQFGVDTPTRVVVIEFLQALITGSKSTLIVPYFDELVSTLTDPFVFPFDSPTLQSACIDILHTILTSIKGKGHKVIEAHYVSTGRLSTLHSTVRVAFRFLLVCVNNPALSHKAYAALVALAELESDHGQGVDYLYRQHSAYLVKQSIDNYEVDSTFSATTCTEHILLHRLILAPRSVVYGTNSGHSSSNSNNGVYSSEVLGKLVEFLCTVHTQELMVSQETENAVLLAISELLVNLLLPLCTNSTDSGNTNPSLANAVTTLAALVPQILTSFVYDARWARTAALHTQRLYVLSLLVQSPLEVKVKVDHVSVLLGDQKTANKGCSESAGPCPYDAILSGDTLLLHTHRILDTILSSALLPSVPFAIRIDALTVCDHMLHLVKEQAGCAKLRSFASTSGSDSGMNEGYKVLSHKVSVNKAFVHLLGALDDSEDAVRIQCLESIRNSASLILSNDDAHTLVTDRNSTDAIAQRANIVHTVRENVCILLDFPRIVKALFERVPQVGVSESEEFVVYLDATLRALCVLDPTLFESLVRNELAPRLDIVSEDGGMNKGFSRDQLNEFVSGLLNHVDILQQFK